MTRSRAAQARPAGTDEVDEDVLDELPVDDVAPPVVVVVLEGDEHAARAKARLAATTINDGRDHDRVAPSMLHWHHRCGVSTLRS